MSVYPGGTDYCWFCRSNHSYPEALSFSWEFDTWVHQHCIIKALQDDPLNPEARIMGREFDLYPLPNPNEE